MPASVPPLGGLHHLTAVSADAAMNRRFYTEVLGLRLVKRTVNQDDVSAWHLFYGDGEASPGSDLTFFVWDLPRERRGGRAIVRTGLRVRDEAALAAHAARLAAAGCVCRRTVEPGGRPGLRFEDPEGQRLVLVVDEAAAPGRPWAGSPLPAAEQILGLGPVTLAPPRIEPTAAFLEERLGFRTLDEVGDPEEPQGRVRRLAVGPGGAAAEVHLLAGPDLPPTRPGAGGAHHVAFRVADRAALTAWASRLAALGVASSGEVERWYFRSLYLREPGGVLLELATDGPGFTVDEPLARLGERLSLPPFLEPRRAAIEAALPAL
jgi:glyoxalase family protein